MMSKAQWEFFKYLAAVVFTVSITRQEWDDGLVEHAKVLALFNDYLTKVLRGLEPSMWRWVAYEDLCEAWGASDFEAADEIADFLGLPPAPLSRAFRYFKPSRKDLPRKRSGLRDAAAEMSPENLRTLRDLDGRKGSSWFPALFPQQRLLRQFANARRAPSRLPPPKDPDNEDEQEDIASLGSKNPAFQQLWETMTPAQRKARLLGFRVSGLFAHVRATFLSPFAAGT
eukprot:s1508_g5.t1